MCILAENAEPVNQSGTNEQQIAGQSHRTGGFGEFGIADGTNPIDGNQIPTGQPGAGYPCKDQPGRAADANGDGVFEPSPCCAWNNTFNGAKLEMTLSVWPDPEQTAKQAAHVKEGRDFFNRKPPAEYYTPYVYPQPLQSGWEALMKSVRKR